MSGGYKPEHRAETCFEKCGLLVLDIEINILSERTVALVISGEQRYNGESPATYSRLIQYLSTFYYLRRQ